MENSSGKKFSFRFLWLDFLFTVRRSSVGFSNIRWSRLMLWCVLFFSPTQCSRNRWTSDDWQTTLGSDGIGYYSYLPATFIYHDYSYLFVPRLVKKYPQLWIARERGFCNPFNGKLVNKYFAGEAVAITPFFLVAHWLSGSNENPADGYSFYYMAAVSLAAIFYVLLGLGALRELLLRFEIREGAVAVVLLD